MQIRWANLFSSRFWIGTAVGALLFAVVAAVVWDPLTVPAFVVGLLLLGWVNLTQQTYRCPACGKSLKTGAEACHHCGRTV